MKRLRRFWGRLAESLIEDHPAGTPQFPVCGHFEETDCTLRGCYAVSHCRLHRDPDAYKIVLARTFPADGDSADIAA